MTRFIQRNISWRFSPALLIGILCVAMRPVAAAETLVSIASEWRFQAAGESPGADWMAPGFNDASWSSGAAPFYNESTALPVPKNTFLPVTTSAGSRVGTIYFRTSFQVTDRSKIAFLVATNYLDDGAVFYLNGSEVGRLRMPPGVPAHDTPAFTAQERSVRVLSLKASSLRDGVNVLAVEVHQDARGTALNEDMVFALSLTGTQEPPEMADLIVWGPSTSTRIEEWTFSSTSCDVREGLVRAGKRRLLRFTTETRNVGTGNLVMGTPAGNPEFVFHACHDHHHFDGFIEYRLVRIQDGEREVVVRAGKASFALEDSDAWSTNAPPVPRFTDENQGIQRGWSDIYSWSLPAQWIDITDVAPGAYVLEMELDPDNRLPELDETNNLTAIPVEVPTEYTPCTAAPINDHFGNALVIQGDTATIVGTTECATREKGEPTLPSDSAERPGGPSVWFRWTATYSGTVTMDTEGSDFDTLLGLYRGSQVDRLTRIAYGDDEGWSSTSRLTAEVIAGVEYSVVLYGWYSFTAGRAETGAFVLNLNPGLNDRIEHAVGLGSAPSGRRNGTIKGGSVRSGTNGDQRVVWYKWGPAETGSMEFTVQSAAPGTRDGGRPWQVSVGGEEIHPSTPTNRVTLRVRADNFVYLSISGDSENRLVPFTLTWSPVLRIRPAWVAAKPGFHVITFPGDECLLETSGDLRVWNPWQVIHSPSGTTFVPFAQPLEAKPQFVRGRTIGYR